MRGNETASQRPRKFRVSTVGLALTVVLVAANLPAEASDYGCRVLLCLSNPAGPTAVSQCVPPIQQLWRDLARVPPRPFPTCDEARPARAVQNTTWYDPCPQGTTALAQGVMGLLRGVPIDTAPSVGIGEGDGLQPNQAEGVTLGPKVCVGAPVGQFVQTVGSGENQTSMLVNVYDQLALLDPATTPRVIDVYLNNALYRRVRW